MSNHQKIFKEYLYRIPILALNCMILGTLVLSCALGSQARRTEPPISLQQLETLCRLPAPCGANLSCRGEAVSFWGYVDPDNISGKRNSPWAPYEKFKVVDHGGRAIEVWPQAEDNRLIFEKLARRPTDRIVVRGNLVPFNMPAASQCNQGIKVLIHDASQVEFK